MRSRWPTRVCPHSLTVRSSSLDVNRRQLRVEAHRSSGEVGAVRPFSCPRVFGFGAGPCQGRGREFEPRLPLQPPLSGLVEFISTLVGPLSTPRGFASSAPKAGCREFAEQSPHHAVSRCDGGCRGCLIGAVQPPSTWNALEIVFTRVCKREPRSCDEILDGL